jgi:hypothetical protein
MQSPRAQPSPGEIVREWEWIGFDGPPAHIALLRALVLVSAGAVGVLVG